MDEIKASPLTDDLMPLYKRHQMKKEPLPEGSSMTFSQESARLNPVPQEELDADDLLQTSNAALNTQLLPQEELDDNDFLRMGVATLNTELMPQDELTESDILLLLEANKKHAAENARSSLPQGPTVLNQIGTVPRNSMPIPQKKEKFKDTFYEQIERNRAAEHKRSSSPENLPPLPQENQSSRILPSNQTAKEPSPERTHTPLSQKSASLEVNPQNVIVFSQEIGKINDVSLYQEEFSYSPAGQNEAALNSTPVDLLPFLQDQEVQQESIIQAYADTPLNSKDFIDERWNPEYYWSNSLSMIFESKNESTYSIKPTFVSERELSLLNEDQENRMLEPVLLSKDNHYAKPWRNNMSTNLVAKGVIKDNNIKVSEPRLLAREETKERATSLNRNLSAKERLARVLNVRTDSPEKKYKPILTGKKTKKKS